VVIHGTACVNDGSGILFGFLEPKRYSGQRVKTPKILLIIFFKVTAVLLKKFVVKIVNKILKMKVLSVKRSNILLSVKISF
jgi:hypothetical protein